ncbi:MULTISPECIES: YDG/SRA domain-containing protein [unclassified Actinoplanes]|uniref:YDG/SRA domain-containing protein n=1 Tax=unclassified Actinoplanes TaxID=2626549 RepID=UPI0009B100E6|nr:MULTISPECIES: YDG/SRA domain-containing protein [unclassified Actinoplanes]
MDVDAGAPPLANRDAAGWLDRADPLVGLSPAAYSTLRGGGFEEFALAAVGKLDTGTAHSVLSYFNVERLPFQGFGDVPGIDVGATFKDRADLFAHRVHRELQAGIAGSASRGAESIVLSGGYTDRDFGDVIIYTGHGGRDPRTKRQIADQDPKARGNAALIVSHLTNAPVRVIRGAHRGSPHAPAVGLRYDGLFLVESFWQEPDDNGFRLCRYRLVGFRPSAVVATAETHTTPSTPLPSGSTNPGRRATTSERIIRNVALANATKALHNHTCQVCDTRLLIQGRGYAEGAHIRPLGEPHNGNDTPDNMLCLCPNCHVLFDNGAITIDADLTIRSDQPHRGILRRAEGHDINPAFLAYHREIYPGN